MNIDENSHKSSNVNLYLGYFDKEISLIALLATFCVTAPLVIIERLATNDHLSYWWLKGQNYFEGATLLMIISATLFYKQKSLLAWFYGQIALFENDATVTDRPERNLTDWLKDANAWNTWRWYNRGFYAFWGALLLYIMAYCRISFNIFYECYEMYICIISLFIYLLVILFSIISYKKYDKEPLEQFKIFVKKLCKIKT